MDAQELGWEGLVERLDEARHAHHVSVRAAAVIAGVPPSTVQGWLNGRHVPTPALRENFTRLLVALDLSDEFPADLWIRPIVMRQSLRDVPAPYLGLRAFGVDDVDLFKGREAAAESLARAVLALPAGRGLVALVGVSGSGKSSLLSAGLVAGQCVSGSLAGWRAKMLDVGDSNSWTGTEADLVVIDQFEDGLAAGRAEDIRAALDVLVTRCAVVIGLRSDSFAQACELPVVAAALAHPLLLTPMNRDELHAAIVLPAREVGAKVDDDLVEVLLDETLPPGNDHASSSSLPLLSNTLLLVWATSDAKRLTLAGYRQMGGLASAIETLAEEIYTSLSPEKQDTARELLLRLTRPIEGGLLRVSLPLVALNARTTDVARALADARLVEFSRDRVRISHDALLTHWTRLRDWVEQRRDDLYARDKLAAAAQLWCNNGREPDSLLPVQRLPLFAEWLDDPARQGLLTPDERDFLAASREHFATQLEAERRASARLRRGRATAITFAVLCLCLTLLATTAFVRATSIQHQAQSRQIDAAARDLRSGDANVRAQMALIADHTASTREGRSALLDASSLDVPVRWPGEGSGVLGALPDSSFVVRGGGQGTVTLWHSDDLTTGPGRSWKADPRGGQLYAVALTRSGTRVLLAVGGTDGFAALWDVTDSPHQLASLSGRTGSGNITALSFSADASLLATGDATGAIHLWSLDESGTPRERGSAANGAPVSGLGFDPSTTTLFASGGNDSVARWTVTPNGVEPRSALGYSMSGNPDVRSLSLAVSPDGTGWLPASPPVLRLAGT